MTKELKITLCCALLVCFAGYAGAASSTGTYTSANCGFPDTGQTLCYDAASQTGCPAPGESFYGQDGNYSSSASQPRFTVRNPVGVSSVTVDNLTGLMWVTDPADAGIGGTYTWEGALISCRTAIGTSGNYAGYNDWRLPKVRELASIVDYAAAAPPAINVKAFPGTQPYNYWTSTTYTTLTTNAWQVNFGSMGGQVTGQAKTMATNMYIRCVRGGAQ